MLYVVILDTPNEKPAYRLVGVFGTRQAAEQAGQDEASEAGNDASYRVIEDDGKDLAS